MYADPKERFIVVEQIQPTHFSAGLILGYPPQLIGAPLCYELIDRGADFVVGQKDNPSKPFIVLGRFETPDAANRLRNLLVEAPLRSDNFVFSLHTGDAKSYPPCGVRIAVSDTYREMVADMIEFFGDAENCDDAMMDNLRAALTDPARLTDTLHALAANRPWAVCSQKNGYHA